MGMAASQARYLALVARKSNCEYEGQQINQSRLNLSNQSANLFNQMLGLNVPVPPSTSDFTKKQYSFTDGISTYTIDKWNQLAEADSEGYNYVVDYHYNADIYTGYQKQKSDPQVQFSIPGAYPSETDYAQQIAQIEQALNNIATCQSTYDLKQAAYKTISAKAAQLSTYADNTTSANVTSCEPNENGDKYTVETQNKDPNGYLEFKHSNESDIDRFYKNGVYYTRAGAGTEEDPYTYTEDTTEDKSGYIAVTTSKEYIKYGTNGMTQEQKATISTAIEDLKYLKALDENYNINNVFYDTTNNTIVFLSDLTNCASGIKTILPLYYFTQQEGMPADVNTISSINDQVAAAKAEMDAAKSDLDNAQADYDALNVPAYIGNCKLTPVATLDDDLISAEVKQIIKDMEDQDVDTNIIKCFATLDQTYDKTTYIGGLYTFEMNGKTYITTYYDLANSINGGTGINNIDDQPRLAYYAAEYLTKSVNKTEKALLETDSTGRFTSIRFEDNTIKYDLNVETITDDAAYKDAMNQFYYEQAVYDKTVQDINAKTSIIQQEDQQLELRLKQLETEQNALKTEIDAVTSVIKDNVEKSFKTFGG